MTDKVLCVIVTSQSRSPRILFEEFLKSKGNSKLLKDEQGTRYAIESNS